MIKRRVDEDIEPVPFHARLRPAKTAATARRISRTVVPRGLTGGSAMRTPMKRPSLSPFKARPDLLGLPVCPFFLLIGPF